LKNNTAGLRERSEWGAGASDIESKATRVGASECGQRTSFNRTRETGNRDEVEGVVANTLKFFRNGAAKPRALCFTLVGFIAWLDVERGCMNAGQDGYFRRRSCESKTPATNSTNAPAGPTNSARFGALYPSSTMKKCRDTEDECAGDAARECNTASGCFAIAHTI
jgi:hypothetical protein